MSVPSQRPEPPPRGTTRSALTQDTVGDLLRSLRTYWWLILLVTVGISAGATAWTVRQPRIYEAVCVVEFDPNPARPLGEQMPDVDSSTSNFWMTREFFATQERVMHSRLIAERVVEALGLHTQRSFLSDAAPAGDDRSSISVHEAAAILQSRVTIEAVRGTRLVQLRVRDTDRDRAALIANKIIEVYLAKIHEDRQGSTVSAVRFLRGQLGTITGQLETSELALHQFKLDHNVLSLSIEDRQNLVAQEIEHFSTALTETRSQRIALLARVARLRSIVEAAEIEQQASALTDVPTVQALREQLRTQLAEHDGLAERYGPNHPRMQELDAQIEGLRHQLREEIAGMMRAAEADVRQASATEAGLRSALDDAQRAGLELNMREIEYTRLSRARDNNEKLYGVLLERTTEAGITQSWETSFVRMVDRALPPAQSAYVSPRLSMNVGLAASIGLALGLLFAFGLGRLDTRIRSVAELEEYGATVLGVLPKMADEGAAKASRRRRRERGEVTSSARDLIAHHEPLSAVSENFRTIRTNLVFMTGESSLHTIAVTSANPREGKTTVAANLAISLAQSGKRVLIIDTDLRRPRIHRAFGLKNAVGVTSVIAGQSSFADAVQGSIVPNVNVMSSGPIPPNPSELLHREAFRQMIIDARGCYDLVIFDSPPLGAVIDAAVLGPQVDGVVLVVRPGETTRQAVRAMLRQLGDVGANLLGAIVNGADTKRDRGYYAGGGYYYYRRDQAYHSSDDDDAPGENGSGAGAEPRGDDRPRASS
ncbi:MAG: polysaccharide biosynthesis tyrosine autokinase [Myxococcota bacterium]|nr:polysaccharide biosynthesis tyrosine autokinase [Myxococcota bacterium]